MAYHRIGIQFGRARRTDHDGVGAGRAREFRVIDAGADAVGGGSGDHADAATDLCDDSLQHFHAFAIVHARDFARNTERSQPVHPAPMKRSTTRFRLSRSRSPAAVKGVGRTEYTPSSFKLLPSGMIYGSFLLYPVSDYFSRKLYASDGFAGGGVCAACADARGDSRGCGGAGGPFRPIYSYFGYDEPNYTYMPNGRKLIGELVALSPVKVQIRAHHMLVTGDGTPALKWGSTNAYTEDAAGKPVYDWTIVDRIIDTYIDAGARPFVEIGFMPESAIDEPASRIAVDWPAHDGGKGWSYPPKDYAKWGELVRQWVLHSVAALRQGRSRAVELGGLERTRHLLLARHA